MISVTIFITADEKGVHLKSSGDDKKANTDEKVLAEAMMRAVRGFFQATFKQIEENVKSTRISESILSSESGIVGPDGNPASSARVSPDSRISEGGNAGGAGSPDGSSPGTVIPFPDGSRKSKTGPVGEQAPS